jgi:hypothetical protein
MNAIIKRQLAVSVCGTQVVGRRNFLRAFSGAALASGSLGWADTLTVHADELRRQGKSCILLWMAGGPSQFETFDPKPGHANGGETKAIATNMAGIQFAENLPKLAQVADKLAVVRSMTTREGEHQRASYLMHTSYLPMASIQYPAIGSVAAHEIAQAECELPAYVRIGQRAPGGAGAGFLGTQYDALTVTAPSRPPENTQTTAGGDRLRSRLGLMNRLQAASGHAELDGHSQLYRDASRMILSPQMEAFDLARESKAVREGYGIGAAATGDPGNRAAGRPGLGLDVIGSGCLLARRLVEAGVTFIEIGVPGWDTHQDNFAASRRLCETIDQPFAYLVKDLSERGLLDKTLIVWMGEFGRTPRINPRGGRDHYPRSFSAVLAGGGVRGGQVIGATDSGGETVADRPVTEKDLFQTIYQALSINSTKAHMTPIGRPIKYVDGGQVVRELLG